MTNKQKKRFKATLEHAAEIKSFYEQFARDNGCELTDFTPIEEDIFGDGIPRCITVFKKQK